MNRIIEVKVNGDYLIKDSDQAGTQYEANVNSLRITFDESWDGFAKKVLFWDAAGKNPVRRILTVDMLENVKENTRVYLCPIPGEPMAVAGKCEFVIEGYVDGKRQRTVADKLKVKPSPSSETETEPADPTPSQAEQIQTQMEAVLGSIQRAILAADVADEAMERAESAQSAAEEAIREAGIAQEMMETGTHAARHAAGGEDQLTPEMIDAATTAQANAAQSAADAAQAAADAAQAAADMAQAKANSAQSAADAAQAVATNAQNAANAAAAAAANANANANGRLSTGGGTVTGRIKAAGFDTTDYTQPFEAPEHIDFHSGGSVLDYNGRLSILTDGDLYYRKPNGVGGRLMYEGNITKSTVDIGEGVEMLLGGLYMVYQ
jgi:hypothetical protein